MKDLKDYDDDVLVGMFLKFGLEQSRIMHQLYMENAGGWLRPINRLTTRTQQMRYEIFLRGPEMARKLLPLLKHPDSWVRYATARQIVEFYEKEAREAVERIVAEAHRYDSIKGQAGMTLAHWDDGTHKHMLPPPSRKR